MCCQCRVLHCSGQRPAPVEPGLRGHPPSVPCWAGHHGPLGGPGLGGCHGRHLQGPAATQSHVPQQLGRPPQSESQGGLIWGYFGGVLGGRLLEVKYFLNARAFMVLDLQHVVKELVAVFFAL